VKMRRWWGMGRRSLLFRDLRGIASNPRQRQFFRNSVVRSYSGMILETTTVQENFLPPIEKRFLLFCQKIPVSRHNIYITY
jgi:hypothetical protein